MWIEDEYGNVSNLAVAKTFYEVPEIDEQGKVIRSFIRVEFPDGSHLELHSKDPKTLAQAKAAKAAIMAALKAGTKQAKLGTDISWGTTKA